MRFAIPSALTLAALCLFACGTPAVIISAPSVAGDPWDSLRRVCINFTNAKRASLAIPQLARWSTADTCSDNQAVLDQQGNVPHGHFGSCGESAQNTCPGWPSSTDTAAQSSVVRNCLTAMWNEGPGTPYSAHGHYINMSNTDYSELTCGFAYGHL